MDVTQSYLKHIQFLKMESEMIPKSEKRKLKLLHSNQGSRTSCLNGFAQVFRAKSLVAYYQDNDLMSFKQHASLYARLRRMYYYQGSTDVNINNFLFPLLSDDSMVIDWFSQYAVPYNTAWRKDRNNPKDFYCHPFHIQLAIAGEWEELAPRCEKVLEIKPPKERKYLVDHRFMLALATGNKQGMIDALDELTSPKVAKIRNKEFELTYTEELISTFACIFMKTAMIHGYELDFENQWIPKDWIPINPPTEVPIPEKWKFMQEYDFWEPLQTEEGADWQIEQYSPKPNARIIIEDRLYTSQ